MAKTKIFNEEGEAGTVAAAENPTEETTVEQTAEEKKDTPKPTATVTSGVKMVKIRVVEDVDCLIACKPYKFAKDKEASVPSDVAAILCYAKKAYRL